MLSKRKAKGKDGTGYLGDVEKKKKGGISSTSPEAGWKI